MESIDANQYSAKQLKDWLGLLGLPTTGTKANLAARLSEVSVSVRGDQPPFYDEIDITVNDKTPETSKKTNAAASDATPSTSQGQDADDAEQSAGTDASVYQNDEQNGETVAAANEGTEIEALKQKIEKLMAQNEEYKKSEREKIDREQREGVQNVSSMPVNANLSNMLLSKFDGKTAANVWVAQLKAVADVYKVDDNMLRMLVLTKLKGEAQAWLCANNSRLNMPINEILNQLIDMFGTKQSKITMRREFEKRKWLENEDFATYFNQKTLLASQIQLDEDELLDHIVEGIPDVHLRRQAHMQCFKQAAQLLSAFEKIKLQKQTAPPQEEKRVDNKVREKTTMRCYNCNSLGHMAAECRKPKRERGACFCCGSMEHQSATCEEKKQRNKYNASSIRAPL